MSKHRQHTWLQTILQMHGHLIVHSNVLSCNSSNSLRLPLGLSSTDLRFVGRSMEETEMDCRNEDDYKLVQDLKDLATEYGVEGKLEFKLNVPFDELKSERNCILAHNSGGPKSDIVVAHRGETVGFLAESPEEYADKIKHILQLSPNERRKIRLAARAAVNERFNEDLFAEGFCGVIGSFL